MSYLSSGEVNAIDEIPERCTEKLVDLVFVLATKLDLNVNDMRELLENSLKEQAQKFENISNKVNDNFQMLNNEIDKLKIENQQQNDKIAELTKDQENDRGNHCKLRENFDKLNVDYEETVKTDFSQRIHTAESNIAQLEDNVAKLKKDCLSDFEKSVTRMEGMEIDILNKMEANGKSLNSNWVKKNEENEEKIKKTIRTVNEKLENHDVKILNHQEQLNLSEKSFTEYQEYNDEKVERINKILIRCILVLSSFLSDFNS